MVAPTQRATQVTILLGVATTRSAGGHHTLCQWPPHILLVATTPSVGAWNLLLSGAPLNLPTVGRNLRDEGEIQHPGTGYRTSQCTFEEDFGFNRTTEYT